MVTAWINRVFQLIAVSVKYILIYILCPVNIFAYDNTDSAEVAVQATGLEFTEFIISLPGSSKDLYLPGEGIMIGIDADRYASLTLNPEYSGEDIVVELAGQQYPVRLKPGLDDVSVKLCPHESFIRNLGNIVGQEDGEAIFNIIIPEGYFRIDYNVEEVTEMPFGSDELEEMSVPGAWNVEGNGWSNQGMFSVHDDDLIDKYVKTSGSSRWMTGGYQSVLYPMLESLGLRGCLAIEGQRCGMTSNPPAINLNGRTALRLQNEKGWELMAHSMTARYDYVNYYVESLDSDLARTILAEGKYSGQDNNNTTSVYDAETGKQYSVNKELDGWVETPREYIKCYVRDYNTGKLKMYNPVFPIDYQWGEFARLASEFGFKVSSWVTPAETSCHINVPMINEILPHGFANFEQEACNVPPLRSAVTRLPMEGLWLTGYKGECDTDNTYNKAHYEYFKSKIDEAADRGGWVVMALHAYRPCWKNSLPGALMSEGGDYPDEWVVPLRDMQTHPDDYLEPPVEKGIEKWSDWYPCPGTRLEMLWDLLKYAKERGLLNVTNAEAFDIMGNRVNKGFYDGGSVLADDMVPIQGATGVYEHYIVGADGSVSYYKPALSASATLEYKISSVSEFECLFPADIYTIDGLKLPVYYVDDLPKGFYIVNGRKIVKM